MIKGIARKHRSIEALLQRSVASACVKHRPGKYFLNMRFFRCVSCSLYYYELQLFFLIVI
jgi:hypothetical protein